ncbi:IucA/IucC family protein [Providencia sp. PROV209]|nr:IucA/IucC family protein [Providencia sp. PROV209]
MQLEQCDSLIFRDNYLTQKSWLAANKMMTKKLLTELTHERIITPILIGEDNYVFKIDSQQVRYHFKAKKYLLEHLDICLDSIKKYKQEQEVPIDALELFIELFEFLEVDKSLLPIHVDEMISTLNSWAYKRTADRLNAEALIHADYQLIESTMDEGHPVLVANKGCNGFDFIDSLKYSPECGAQQHVVWIAVYKEKATFSAISSLNYQDLIHSELSKEEISHFNEVLQQNEVLNEDYYWMPVHQWQWREKVLIRFAADIARKKIIYLGISSDSYKAQQSIRTLFNVSQPNKRYIKLAISIFNSGFMRGLSPYAMKTAPAVNESLDNIFSQDAYLIDKNFKLLKEVAAIGYRDTLFERVITEESPQKHMLSALWRENPYDKIDKNQRLMTMASLLHIDNHGTSFLIELIKASGLSGREWIREYLKRYLSPLLHLFYAYDVVFMPHGENVILIIEEDKPAGIFMKDIAEEVGILNHEGELPEALVERAYTMLDSEKIEHFWTESFDYFFRYMAVILDKNQCLDEDDFWRLVADNIHEYQEEHPELHEKYVRLNLFEPAFKQTCLNQQKVLHGPECLSLIEIKTNKHLNRMISNPLFLFKK